MNSIRILNINHSLRFERELTSEPVPRERNVNILFRELVEKYGRERAKQIAFSCDLRDIDIACATFIKALDAKGDQ